MFSMLILPKSNRINYAWWSETLRKKNNEVPRVEVMSAQFSDLKSIELYHCWIKESNLKLHTIWKFPSSPVGYNHYIIQTQTQVVSNWERQSKRKIKLMNIVANWRVAVTFEKAFYYYFFWLNWTLGFLLCARQTNALPQSCICCPVLTLSNGGIQKHPEATVRTQI